VIVLVRSLLLLTGHGRRFDGERLGSPTLRSGPGDHPPTTLLEGSALPTPRIEWQGATALTMQLVHDGIPYMRIGRCIRHLRPTQVFGLPVSAPDRRGLFELKSRENLAREMREAAARVAHGGGDRRQFKRPRGRHPQQRRDACEIVGYAHASLDDSVRAKEVKQRRRELRVREAFKSAEADEDAAAVGGELQEGGWAVAHPFGI
tara:strand:- start:105 stop:719 length:615 start_codon:yes stop_codon:yes gene_type:complete